MLGRPGCQNIISKMTTAVICVDFYLICSGLFQSWHLYWSEVGEVWHKLKYTTIHQRDSPRLIWNNTSESKDCLHIILYIKTRGWSPYKYILLVTVTASELNKCIFNIIWAVATLWDCTSNILERNSNKGLILIHFVLKCLYQSQKSEHSCEWYLLCPCFCHFPIIF